MNDFLAKHFNKVLGSTGLLGVFQLIFQLRDYLSDGQLDTHEIEQLFLSSTSALQTSIIIFVVIYVKFFKK